MNRRQFLAGLGAASSAALAGCSGSLGTTELSDPEVTTEAGETHLTYRDEDGRIAVTSVQYGPVRAGNLVRMRLSVWHRRGTTLTDLEATFRNRDPTAVRPAVYVGGMSGDFPPIARRIDDETDGRVLAVPDLTPVGEGTVTFELYVQEYSGFPLELTIDMDYGLDAGTLQFYEVDGTMELTIPGPENGDE